MQLSQTAEYALRAIVWLAEHPGDPQTTQQIADGCKMPASYLSKVLQPLAKLGLITAQRGLGGGHTLAMGIEQISLLDVVNAVEPVQRIRTCPLKLESHGSKLCALHQMLDDTMAAVEQRFATISIEQLLQRSTGVDPLCEAHCLGPAGEKANVAAAVTRSP